MKTARLALTILLMLGTIAWAQEKEKTEPQPQERPTLRPGPSSPALSGPHTSTTTDPRRLLIIRTIYVEPMDNSLNERLVEGLAKLHRFKLVTRRNEADAILRGTCFDSHHLKTVHSEVFLSDRSSGAPVWQDVVRVHFNPPTLSKAVIQTAEEIIQHLSGSIGEAERK